MCAVEFKALVENDIVHIPRQYQKTVKIEIDIFVGKSLYG